MVSDVPPNPPIYASPYRCNHGSRRWAPAEVRCVVRIVFRRAGQVKALRVASCESGFNTYSVSRTDDWSVFQINRPSHPDYFVGDGWRRRFDPVYNSRYALRLSRNGSRWAAWTCQ